MRPLPLFDTPEKQKTLPLIRTELGECRRCKLCTTRKRIVFGHGNSEAKLMLIGEAPGEREDETGFPFVGKAGDLLTEILIEKRVNRSEVYITNCIKCRPPGNRQPEEDEVLACRPFLEMQILSIKPKIIVAFGKYAAQWLLGEIPSIMKVRGRIWRTSRGIVIPTYHPAHVLRNPHEIGKLRGDLDMAIQLANRRAEV